jgi:hypothetical protein
VANEEWGIFLKLLNRKLEEAAALAKARIPKLQENLLKRTAKIETQAGAAQNNWLRERSVAAAKGKKI